MGRGSLIDGRRLRCSGADLNWRGWPFSEERPEAGDLAGPVFLVAAGFFATVLLDGFIALRCVFLRAMLPRSREDYSTSGLIH